MAGDKVIIADGRHKGAVGTVDSIVLQKSADCGAASSSYHVILENDDVVTVRRDHVKAH